MMMTNPKTTKLRILAEHAKRQQDETARIALEARRNAEAAWMAYVRARMADGYCPNCDRPLPDCQCIAVASAAEPPVVAMKGPEGPHCPTCECWPAEPSGRCPGSVKDASGARLQCEHAKDHFGPCSFM